MEVYSLANDDLCDIMLMSVDMLHESPNYRDLPLDVVKVGAWAAMHIREDDMAAWGVRNKAGDLVAAMFASCAPTYFGPTLVAKEDALYVAAAYRGTRAAVNLMSEFLKWADNKGATRIVVTPSTGIDHERACSFLGKFGFKKMATSMVLDRG